MVQSKKLLPASAEMVELLKNVDPDTVLAVMYRSDPPQIETIAAVIQRGETDGEADGPEFHTAAVCCLVMALARKFHLTDETMWERVGIMRDVIQRHHRLESYTGRNVSDRN
jgi:hypothetical protein